MSKLPTLFISHGAPDLILSAVPARDFLSTLGTQFARPRAIVIASAHYDEGPSPHVTVAAEPRTIHDFGGFDPRLYQMHYRAPGAPALAGDIVTLLNQHDLKARADPAWGFDHGTWVPLMLMYPEADIPVVALSIHLGASPTYHLQLGRALQGLSEQNILIMGSGAFTHNLREIAPPAQNTDVPAWASRFADWTAERIVAGDEAALLEYRARAPHARENHPTDEHLMPLFVAMGAAGENWRGTQLHSSVTYGSIRMDAYAFAA